MRRRAISSSILKASKKHSKNKQVHTHCAAWRSVAPYSVEAPGETKKQAKTNDQIVRSFERRTVSNILIIFLANYTDRVFWKYSNVQSAHRAWYTKSIVPKWWHHSHQKASQITRRQEFFIVALRNCPLNQISGICNQIDVVVDDSSGVSIIKWVYVSEWQKIGVWGVCRVMVGMGSIIQVHLTSILAW